MAKIAIMDHSNSSIRVMEYNAERNGDQTEDIEAWLSQHHKLSEISWMYPVKFLSIYGQYVTSSTLEFK